MSGETTTPAGERVEKVFSGELRIPVQIRVRDDRILRRCVENWDPDGNPAEPGTNGWRDMLYPLDTDEKVLEHLAYNRFWNLIEQVSRLDGFADIDFEIEDLGHGLKQLNPAVVWIADGPMEFEWLTPDDPS